MKHTAPAMLKGSRLVRQAVVYACALDLPARRQHALELQHAAKAHL